MNYFAVNFKFSPNETVAIMGAHNVGGATGASGFQVVFTEVSGFQVVFTEVSGFQVVFTEVSGSR
jgi:hypothetical protein